MHSYRSLTKIHMTKKIHQAVAAFEHRKYKPFRPKIKGLLALGDITPRTKSNLLETLVSNRYSNFLRFFPGYSCIVCH